MYRIKDKKTGYLFKDMLPFGGKLDENNRWIKLSGLIPWEDLEIMYAETFSTRGRPGKDSRLVLGLLILRHINSFTDEEVIMQLTENPYLQYFCGFEEYKSGSMIDRSTLSRVRERLGEKGFNKFETAVMKELINRRIIKGKKLLIDATVVPSDITYPTDIKIVNTVREWLCKGIKKIRRTFDIKERVRTYARTARKIFLNTQKKRSRTIKEMKIAVKKILRHVKRNIKQIETIYDRVKDKAVVEMREEIENGLAIARKIYEQQTEMIRAGVNVVKDRIVSFHQEYVRPMVRGKDGKKVEFGPKVSVSSVGGYMFLDKFNYNAYNESEDLAGILRLYKNRFGKLPEEVIADNIYGTRWNRKLLKRIGIRSSFKRLGRKSLLGDMDIIDARLKKSQKLRNRIEGGIGTAKTAYDLDRIKYRTKEGGKIWIQMGLLSNNLMAALKTI